MGLPPGHARCVGDERFAARLRDELPGRLDLSLPQIVSDQLSSDGTHKLLLAWPDGAEAETVMIPHGQRRTACVSSQVGCPVGCRFCASGVAGLKQNLTAGRIAQQIYHLNLALAGRNDAVGRVTNVVFMGMGEPLSNYAPVVKATKLLHDPSLLNLGYRRMTLRHRRRAAADAAARRRGRADQPRPVAARAEEELRRSIIPWAEHFELGDILAACRYYFEKTGREVTFEYILLRGVNDAPSHARALADICRRGGFRVNVNLIRYNEVAGLPFERPTGESCARFQSILRDAGVTAHVRKSRGRDIDAACGQLRRKQTAADVPELVQLTRPERRASQLASVV